MPARATLRIVPGRQLLARTPCISTGSSLRYCPWLRFSQCSPPSRERIMPPTSIAPYNRLASAMLPETMRTRLAGLAPGAHGDFRKAHTHRQLAPRFPAIVTTVDFTRFIASEHDFGIARMKHQRPDRQAMIGNIDFFPVIPIVRTAIGTMLGANVHDFRFQGVCRNGSNGRGFRKAVGQ